MGPSVEQVEIRLGTRVLQRRRPTQGPVPVPGATLAPTPPVLTWDPITTRVRLSLETAVNIVDRLGSPAKAWLPVACPEPEAGTLALSGLVLEPMSELRLSVSDGWRAWNHRISVPTGLSNGTLVIRQLPDKPFVQLPHTRFVLTRESIEADATPQRQLVAVPQWSWGDTEDDTSTDRELLLPPEVTGSLTAEHDGETVTRHLAGHPSCLPERRVRSVVLLTPAVASGSEVLPPVDAGDLQTRIEAAANAAILDLEVLRLPWAPDALAVLASTPDGAADPVAVELIGLLDAASLGSPGLEDAVWLVVVPGERDWSLRRRGDAARWLCVCSPSGLSELFEGLSEELSGDDSTQEQEVLRVEGSLLDGDRIELRQVLRERRTRALGTGAASILSLAFLDAADQDLATTPLRGATIDSTGRFAMLSPLPSGTAAVEIRHEDQILRRITRSRHRPELVDAEVAADGVLRATGSHSGRLHMNLRLEASVPGPTGRGVRGWASLWCVDPSVLDSATGSPARLERLGPHGGLRLRADDGWHTALADVAVTPEPRDAAVTVRSLGENRWVLTAGRPPVPKSASWAVRDDDGGESLLGSELVMHLESGLGTLAATVEVSIDGTLTDARILGPRQICLPLARQRPLVLFLPSQVLRASGTLRPPVDRGALDLALLDAERTQALRLSPAIELPVVDDLLATLPGPVDSELSPTVTELMAVLSRRAVETVGAESAVWLAVLPGDNRWHALRTAPGAALLGACSLRGLPDLVAAAVTRLAKHPPRREAEDVLRVVGHIDHDGLPTIERVREEHRPSGRVKGTDTKLYAVMVDDQNHMLFEQAVTVLDEARPATFTALWPVSEGVRELQLRWGKHVLARVGRESGPPKVLDVPRTVGDQVTWTSSEGRASQIPVVVELAASGGERQIWTISRHAAPGARAAPLRRISLAPWSHLRVVAEDGWHGVPSDSLAASEEDPQVQVVIRRTGPRSLAADVRRLGEPVELQGDEAGAAVAWASDGDRPVAPGTRAGVTLVPPKARGPARLYVCLTGEPVAHFEPALSGAPPSLPLWLHLAHPLEDGRILVQQVDGSLYHLDRDRLVAILDRAGRPGVLPPVRALVSIPKGSTPKGGVVLGDSLGGLAILRGDTLEAWSGHRDAVVALAIAHSEGAIRLLSGSRDGSALYLPDLSQPGNSIALRGRQGALVDVGLSADGRLLATVGRDGSCRVWDAQGEPARAFRQRVDRLPAGRVDTERRVLLTRHAPIVRVALLGSPDLVITGDDSGCVYAWRAHHLTAPTQSLRPDDALKLAEHTGSVVSLVVDESQRHVGIAWSSGRVLRLPTPLLGTDATGVWEAVIPGEGDRTDLALEGAGISRVSWDAALTRALRLHEGGTVDLVTEGDAPRVIHDASEARPAASISLRRDGGDTRLAVCLRPRSAVRELVERSAHAG